MRFFKTLLYFLVLNALLSVAVSADITKIIKMCNNPNWTPVEFARDGNMSDMQGIAMDTLKILETNLNISFQNVPTKSWSQSQEFLAEGKCDILPAAIETSKRKEYANFTKPYLVYKLAIVTRDDKPFIRGIEDIIDKSIARKKGSGLIDKLKDKYPKVNIIETIDYFEAFQKVSRGDAYSTIASIPVMAYYVNNYGLNNLHIVGYMDMEYRLSIAVSKDNPRLLSLLDKGLSDISFAEHRAIYHKWTNQEIVEAFDYKYLLYGGLLALIIALFVVYRQIVLKKANKELEAKVKEKMEENLMQHQLLQEQSKLAAMGEMIGAIAHQWRQPLNALGLSIQNLEYNYKDGLIDEAFIENYVRKNKITIKFMSQTIDDFRSFFRADKIKETFSVKIAIDSTLAMQSIYMEKHNIEFKLLGKDFKVYGLRSEFQQVILSLLSNSKDALVRNRSDKRIIKISLEDNAIIFSDNAKGIPEHILDKIFDPYFTTKKEGEGTGIGLYMSKMIVEDKMGGTITAYNHEDGAVFLLDFKGES